MQTLRAPPASACRWWAQSPKLLVAPEDPQQVLERIASPHARIVSLTVTEKGYCHDPATGKLRLDHPDIAHDLAHPAAPRSAVGLIVRGLALRHSRGLGPVTLMSLDNLPANGHVLQGAVLRLAEGDPPGAGRLDRQRLQLSLLDGGPHRATHHTGRPCGGERCAGLRGRLAGAG